MRNLTSKKKKKNNKLSSKLKSDRERRSRERRSRERRIRERRSRERRSRKGQGRGWTKKKRNEPKPKLFLPTPGAGKAVVEKRLLQDQTKLKASLAIAADAVWTADIKNINYTQKECSHSFSDGFGNLRYENITSEFKRIEEILINKVLYPANKQTIINKAKLSMPHIKLFFTLEVFKKDGILYSCNNRRLCLLKLLNNANLFDGTINIKYITEEDCGHRHTVDLNYGDITVKKGDDNDINCSNLLY